MSQTNLERLLRLDSIIDKLSLGFLHKEITVSPFSTRVTALGYEVKAKDLRLEDFESLDIVTKDIKLTIDLEGAAQWGEIFITLLKRIARLGNFESLTFDVYRFSLLPKMLDFDQAVAALLANAISGNPHLAFFDFKKHASSN